MVNIQSSQWLPPSTSVAPAPRRLIPPQLDGHAIAQRNRIYSAPAARLRNGHTLVWQDSGPLQPSGELICKAGDLRFAVSAHGLSTLEPRLLGLESSVPSHACTTLVEHALAPMLDQIETLSSQRVTCEEFVRVDGASPHRQPVIDRAAVRIGFALFSSADQPSVRGSMRACSAFWRSLDFSRPPVFADARQQAVPLCLTARLGRCRLPLAELRELQQGDALRVTPKPPRHAVGLAVQLGHSSGRFGCRARLIDDQLILETPMDSLTDTSPSPAAATLANPGFATGIECELSFELGSIRMTLGEIAALRAGHALRLGLRLEEQPVSILANGRQIARGELAAVGDELVVVVTQTHGLPDI